MKTDGLIFDLDGTLWDSCRSVAESWQATVRRYYQPDRVFTTEQIRGVMGMTAGQIAQVLLPELGDRGMEACLKCLEEECAYIASAGAHIYPGAREALERLCRRCPLFIVSNCLEGYVECFLACSGFAPLFKGFLHPGLTGLDKAGNIRSVIDRFGLERPVYVGDTPMDLAAAKAAGCAFIHAAYGFGAVPEAEVSIGSLGELERLLSFD